MVMLVRYLPRIKTALRPSTTSLTAFRLMKLLGLRDNLDGIEIRTDDGRRLDPSVGDPSRDNSYNRRTGKIEIEILYNMYRVKPAFISGHSQLCHARNLQVKTRP
jgi:hypothetical protein